MENQQQLFNSVCRLAGEAVVRYNMTRDGDRVLVGLSGGKDSFVLMHVLDHLQKVAPVSFSFAAATFDPGFEDFGVPEIAAYCREHGWEHHVIKMDIASIIKEKEFGASPYLLPPSIYRHLMLLRRYCESP